MDTLQWLEAYFNLNDSVTYGARDFPWLLGVFQLTLTQWHDFSELVGSV